MISQTVEYALRAIVTIAQHGGQPITARQISTITRVPAPYLSKLMQGLVRERLVHSQRGPNGGFSLQKSADDLTIWEVVQAVEPFKRIHECPLGIEAHGGALCPLHQRLDNAMALVEESFKAATVAEVLAHPGSSTPLCEESTAVTIDMKGIDGSSSPDPASKGEPKRT